MAAFRSAPTWLSDAVLYQLYPQSFADSDGDGIGDFNGVTERLEYLSWLGVNTVWINPCFVSPFGDAGYDVADHLRVAPRYGAEADLVRLIEQARRQGIRILFDLVPGHTSDQHPWFLASAQDPDDHRFVWCDSEQPPAGFVPSPGSRPGAYLPNFFSFQPALNFGYARSDPAEPWRQSVDAEGPRANRAALREIMDHWLSLGIAGFRVDMAGSLVKDDPGHIETGRLWADMRHWLDASHPEAVLFSEWGDPVTSVPAGFHADFFLQFGGKTEGRPFRSLWNNRQGTDNDDWDPIDCFFDAAGNGSPQTFVTAWREATDTVRGGGHIAVPSANHDFARLRCGERSAEQLAAAFAFLLTWPTLPTIYYGDEIGMRFVPGLPDTEGSVLGSRYNRAGSRTPMQWDGSSNAGFSTAPADQLYLPLDPEAARPNVEAQRCDPTSLLNLVRQLIALRRGTPALGPAATVEVLSDGYPFAYLRGGDHLVVVNPRRSSASVRLTAVTGTAHPELSDGVRFDGDTVTVEGFGYGVFRLDPAVAS